MLSAPAYSILLAALILTGPLLVSARGDEPASPAAGIDGSAPTGDLSTARLQNLVKQLGEPDYRGRELATQQLIAAGPAAIELLADAAKQGDLEVSYRVVRVLQALLDSHDSKTQEPAVDALETMAADKASPVAALAADVLGVYWMTQPDRAVEALRRLGAIVDMSADSGVLSVTLGAKWQGTTTDLIWLRRLPMLIQLRVYIPLDQDGIENLRTLTQVSSLDLYGTGITDDQLNELAAALPGVHIDRRQGALLGVAKNAPDRSNKVDKVHAGSAAEQADIRLGDEIVNFDGVDVQNFDQLTKLIGGKAPGERVSIRLVRGEETLTKEVTLGRWEGGEHQP